MKAERSSRVAESSSKFNGVRTVSDVAMEMHKSIITLAGEREWFENRDRWLEKAAHAAGISYRRAKAFFYRESVDPKSSAVDRVRIAVKRLEASKQEAAARDEYIGLLERITTLAARLDATDEDFHREVVAGLRGALLQGGGAGRPVDRDDDDGALK